MPLSAFGGFFPQLYRMHINTKALCTKSILASEFALSSLFALHVFTTIQETIYTNKDASSEITAPSTSTIAILNSGRDSTVLGARVASGEGPLVCEGQCDEATIRGGGPGAAQAVALTLGFGGWLFSARWIEFERGYAGSKGGLQRPGAGVRVSTPLALAATSATKVGSQRVVHQQLLRVPLGARRAWFVVQGSGSARNEDEDKLEGKREMEMKIRGCEQWRRAADQRDWSRVARGQ
ncbi:hypothetical protein C8F04DRAFT_1237470 [Mycena alexandri]|uniref:Uncharacterized protein n=1 Tax=Mycena alexandri TaxID=1745969 RepID=A0AAD6X182_9AGAR|nr:hypothetical protein C8F04DRAFT_1237470 [Mycena alexandri]